MITRGEFFMIKEMYERGKYFRYRKGRDRSENRPKIYSLSQSPFQIQAKTNKKNRRIQEVLPGNFKPAILAKK